MANKRTALYSIQAARGAKMVDFHGWDMPVQFAGILAEHRTVRTGCGIFDLGHMGRLHLSGGDALAFLQSVVCRGLAKMAVGQVRYGLVLNAEGGTEDDVLVSREDENAFHVVVNASNHKKIKGLWAPGKEIDVDIRDLSEDQAMLAAQGPESSKILSKLDLDPGDLGYYHFVDREWDDVSIRLSRTGYTGEDGFELFLPDHKAEKLWESLIEAGATPCGLGCRDTLRLEAGMPLYGNELDTEHTPLEAGLEFAIGWKKDFIGKERLEAQREEGVARKLVGLTMDGRRAPRQGYAVLAGDEAVGAVTSGSFSPTLERSIAMAYVATAHAEPGTGLTVDLRGKPLPATVVDLPFYKRGD